MSLLEQYEILLDYYGQVLTLSKTILAELEKKGSPGKIIILVEQKQAIAKNIAGLTVEISATEVKGRKDPNLQNLAAVKILLLQIAEKAKQIQKTEEKMQSYLSPDDTG